MATSVGYMYVAPVPMSSVSSGHVVNVTAVLRINQQPIRHVPS